MSDPPEEEEQEKECEDVGVAYFRLSDILKKQRDMIDISLDSECFSVEFYTFYSILGSNIHVINDD